MSQQQQKEPKMGPVDLALYGVILCIHYPLKLTFATYRTSKAAVVNTVSLPRRTLNYTFSTVSSVKQGTERRVRETIDLAINSVLSVKQGTERRVRGTIDLARNTVSSVKEGTERRVRGTINLARNTASSAITLSQNLTAYAFNLLQRAKAEANHQFETRINEPKHQYEKAFADTKQYCEKSLSDTATSVSDYAHTTATSVSDYAHTTATSVSDYAHTRASTVKKDTEGIIRGSINFARNVSLITYNAVKQLSEDVNEQAELKEPKNQYEKTFAKFQAAAFETERQNMKQEILKLNEELKRGQQKHPGSDKERLKCDKQIHDLQEQLTRIHLTYTQQKQHLLAEFDKERQTYKQELQKLNQQLTQAQISYEHLSKKQVIGFDKERQQYQDEIQRLLQQIGKLRQELMKYEDANHNEEYNDEGDANEEEPYVTDAFHKIDAIKKEVHDLKKKIGEFVGTEKDKEYLHLNELLIRHIIKLDNIESKGFNVVKKRRKEALRFVQKCQEELKSKV